MDEDLQPKMRGSGCLAGIRVQLAAVAIAALAQAGVHTRPYLSLGGYLLGFVLFLFAARRIPRKDAWTVEAARTAPRDPPRFWELLALGSLLCAAAGAAVYRHASLWLSHGLWFAGLAVLAGNAIRSRHGRTRSRSALYRTLPAYAILLLLAGGFFGWHVSSIPPEVHGDDAEVGLDAVRLIEQRPLNLFRTSWFELPILHAAPTAVGVKLFGTNTLGLRSQSVAFGAASVLLLFFLVNRLWGFELACLASAFLVSARFFVHLSRTGFHYIHTPFLSLLALVLFLQAWRYRRSAAAIWCGIALGLGIQSYYASRLVPVLLALTWAIWLAQSSRGLRWERVRQFALIVVTALATAAPMAGYFARHWDDLWWRVQSTSVFAKAARKHIASGYGTQDLGPILALQFRKAFTLFNATPDSSLQYGAASPLLEPISAVLFVLGLAVLCARPRRRRHQLVLLWLVVPVVLGAALTIDTPFYPRISGTIPFAAIAAAMGLQAILNGVRSILPGRGGRCVAGLVAVAVVGSVFANNIRSYFLEYAPAHHLSPAVDISHWVVAHGTGKTTYMVGGAPDFFMGHGTIRFLTHGYRTRDIVNLDSFLRGRRLAPATNAFIIMPRGHNSIAKLTAAIGPLDVKPHTRSNGELLFYSAVPVAAEHRAAGQARAPPPPGEAAGNASRFLGTIPMALLLLASAVFLAAVMFSRRRGGVGTVRAGPFRARGKTWLRLINSARTRLFGPDATERSLAPSRRTTVILLALIVCTAAVLRIYRLGDLPAGFYCDEAGLGYNAHLLMKSGRDETQAFLPLYTWSFGTSYKNPVFIYSSMLPIAVFGLSEFSVRLTSALYGTGTVLAMYFLGRALMGGWVGLLAAAFLAVCPWHLHFSRIAFELIAFPFFFTVGVTQLVRYGQGRRTLPIAAVFLGFCFYTYAIAKLFVPLFLVGFAALYLPALLRRRRESLLAILLLMLTVVPGLAFDLLNTQRASAYFSDTTMLDPSRSALDLVQRFAHNYTTFFSRGFLFERGDAILRHAVQGHGELYWFFVPILFIGAVTALGRRDRAMRLPLWWLALYPAGATMMNEIPSASRGFIGAPAFCLLAAVGGGFFFRLPVLVTHRPRRILLAQFVLAAGLATIAVPQVRQYWTLYTNRYPTYSARYYSGFQFGHREVVDYFLLHAGEYDEMVLTTDRNNQPDVFLRFYAAARADRDKGRSRAGTEPGWKMHVGSPEELQFYDPPRRLLFAVRDDELRLFADYRVEERVLDPGGSMAFALVEVKSLKDFVTTWRIGGRHPVGETPPLPTLAGGSAEGESEMDSWPLRRSPYASVRLNRIFGGEQAGTCVWAYNSVDSPADLRVAVHAGFDDQGEVWINGDRIVLHGGKSRNGSFVDTSAGAATLHKGWNPVLVRACNDYGDWRFYFRLAGPTGGKLSGLSWERE